MTERILAYCVCSSSSVREKIKLYETQYNCLYNWNESFQGIPEAKVVAVKEIDGHRCVITHSDFKYFSYYYNITTTILGEL